MTGNLRKVIKFSLVVSFCIIFISADLSGRINNDKNFSADKSTVFDAHVHAGFEIKNGEVVFSDSDYLENRGIKSFAFPLPVDRSETTDLFARISREVSQIKQICNETNKLNFYRPNTPMVQREGHTIYLGIEYFHGVFGDKPDERIKKYRDLGIKYITFIHGKADILFNEREKLSIYGDKIINAMNEEGLMIDISHLNEQRALSVIRSSKMPVIASHSGIYSATPNEGNLTDKILIELSKTKGFVMLSFNNLSLISNTQNSTSGVENLIDHIDHVKKFLPIDQIGIGTDYQAEGKYIPKDLNKTNTFEKLRNRMMERGYSANEIFKIFEKNLLKMFL